MKNQKCQEMSQISQKKVKISCHVNNKQKRTQTVTEKNKSNSCRQRRLQIKVMHTFLRKIIHMEECIPAVQQYIEK